MKASLKGMLAVGVLAASTAAVFAAGNWSTLPLVGGASYCASTVTGTGNLSGVTGQGQGTIGSICGQTVPAGPATFAGTEVVPMDLATPGATPTALGAQPATALVNINQLGQGAVFDSTSASAGVTVPNGVQFFVLDTGTAATVAVTLPAVAVEGQIVHINCAVGGATAFSVVPNSGQALKGTSPGACTAGSESSAWRFSGTANGLIAANTWLRIQ
jgi:hypothetical protein